MRSRIIFLLVFSLGIFFGSMAQELHAHWTQEVKKVSDCEYDLIFKVKIDPLWHVYSQVKVKGDGPNPTKIAFEKSPDYDVVGSTKESKPIEEDDKVFEMKVRYFIGNATFTTRVKLKTNKKIVIKGTYEYQICTDEACMFPPAEKFEFELPAGSAACVSAATNTTVAVTNTITTVTDTGKINDSLKALAIVDSIKKAKTSMPKKNEDPVAEGAKKEEVSLWSIFIKGFLGGLFAVFTPCLFPLIPMNVSFFTKRSKTRAKGISNASLYSFFVILIYVALGMGVALALGPDRLNAMSTNKYVNIVFFAIFLIFAISFFGAFDITLPSGFVNKMDSMSDRGGIVGIFFMAFTLVLVSFSCTGPIASSLLIEAASSGKLLGPGIGMFGFGLALALPFGLFAFAPALMNSLPKSGGWLNTVKVCLGFIELAFAMKFISNADLVTQSFIITREVFITSWVVIFGLMGVYLLGAFKMAHDTKTESVSITKLLFALFSFFIVIYILPGLWGAPLKMLSGILPPSDYTESKHNPFAPPIVPVDDEEFKQYIVSNHGINMFKNDYEHALAYAKKINKPLMIDFTGHNCANCRKTEDYIWSDEIVTKILNEDVVLVSLYADEDADLPKEEQKQVQFFGRERTLETVGDKWKYFEFSRYNAVQQPLYVIVDHNEKTLVGPRGYEAGVEDYTKWLQEGIKKFKALKK